MRGVGRAPQYGFQMCRCYVPRMGTVYHHLTFSRRGSDTVPGGVVLAAAGAGRQPPSIAPVLRLQPAIEPREIPLEAVEQEYGLLGTVPRARVDDKLMNSCVPCITISPSAPQWIGPRRVTCLVTLPATTVVVW